MPHVDVSLVKAERERGLPAFIPHRHGTTSDRGEYRFEDVAPGKYYIHASQPRQLGGSEPLVQQFLGQTLNIREGETLAGIDFHMRSEQAVQIHGRVTGATESVDIVLSPANEFDEQAFVIRQTAKPPDYAFAFSAPPAGRDLVNRQCVDTSSQPGDVLDTGWRCFPLPFHPELAVKSRRL